MNKSYIKDNTGTENYFFSGTTHFTPFDVLLSGITYPNPSYHISHPPSNQWVFEYVYSGKGYIETSNTTYVVTKGDFYIISQYADCRYYSDKKDPLNKIWFNLSGNFVENICHSYGFRNNITIIKKDVSKYFEKICDSFNNQVINIEQFHTTFFEMIVHLSLENPTTKSPSIVDLIYDYIVNHISDPINIGKLADDFYISRAHLTSIFKKKYNKSPYNFYLELKLSIAKDMLTNTNLRIKEIAEKLSFYDSHHFTNCFQRYYGYSPSEFIKSIKGTSEDTNSDNNN